MTEPRPSFLRVWIGLLLLTAVSALPAVTGAWLLSLIPMPWWLGLISMMVLALSFGAWVMTSTWLRARILTLSRWVGMLP